MIHLDLQANTRLDFQVSDLESQVPGSILTGGNILLLEFLCHVVKPILLILAILCASEKPEHKEVKIS